MQAGSVFKASIGIRHYVAKEDRWIEKPTIDLPPDMVARFVAMIEALRPGLLERIK